MPNKTFHFDVIDVNFNNQIFINTPIRKIKSLELKQCQISNPANIRKENETNQFQFYLKSNTISNNFEMDVVPFFPPQCNNNTANFRNFNLAVFYKDVRGTTQETVFLIPLSKMYFNTMDDLLTDLCNVANGQFFYQSYTCSIRYLINTIDNAATIIITGSNSYGPYLIKSISVKSDNSSMNYYLNFTNSLNPSTSINCTNGNFNFYYYQNNLQKLKVTLSNKYVDMNELYNDLTTQLQTQYQQQNNNNFLTILFTASNNNKTNIQFGSGDPNIDYGNPPYYVNIPNQITKTALGFDGNEVYRYNSVNNQIVINFTSNLSSNINIYNEQFQGTLYTATYPTGSFYDAYQFVGNLINTIYSPVLPSNISINYSINIGGYFTINYNDTNSNTLFQLVPSNTTVMLGYRNNDLIQSNSLYIASILPNLKYDTYINLYIHNLQIQGQSSSGKNSTFKIPLNFTDSHTSYTETGTGYKQRYEISDPLTINYVQCEFYDRIGKIVNIEDYNFTIAFEFE